MRLMTGILLLAAMVCLLATPTSSWALGGPPYVSTTPAPGSFVLVEGQDAATIWVDAADWPGVIRAARDLQADITRVTPLTPAFVQAGLDAPPRAHRMVIVGTVGRSPLIDRLVREGKIDVSGIRGKWESFFLETVADPMPGVDSALVIAGSDKRGTIYGIYDLSEQIGVSPWYWWADVTPERKAALYVLAGKHQQGEPSVRYRGIFLNDERPNLDYWVRATFGEHPTPGGGQGTVANFNGAFYARLFEVMLRMKANYLWPAMWNNAFAEDDPDNPRLADEYGIVMGSTHQEPMMRAQKEWDWHLREQHGNWNYAAHPEALNEFWRTGVRARKDFENVYTVGLRGENDAPMVRTVEEGVVLTERIVAEQRRILADEVNPDVTRVPQLWSLYKEVQNYYERGLRVPDDITLLWAEDNWGNIRRLPTPDERRRSGGAGVYYHFDYHGGPRSYQWIDTNPIPKIAEQMSLAKQYGADRIWIVNVGHFKAYTFPMEYFLALAWDTDRWTAQNTAEYTKLWAAREFGPPYAGEIAEIVATYTKYNGRRKPELLDATTYSLVNYREAERVVADYNALVVRAEAIYEKLPAAKKDAFYQLALFPAKASANVNEMYVAAARNALYAAQGRASTNDWGDRTKALFQVDADLMTYFNTVFAGGKWNHFMDQPHIGYTSWRDPPANNMDAIRLTELTVPAEAGLGVSVDGSEAAWPAMPSAPAVAPAAPPAPPAPPAARGAAGGRGAGPGRGRGGFGRGGGPPAAPPISAVPTGPATLPRFDALNRQDSYIDVFNRGRTPYEFTATPSAPWIVVSQRQGTVEKDVRLDVSIDWTQAPVGTSDGTVMVRGAGREVAVALSARKPAALTRATLEGFAEGGGYVSMEAEDYARRTDAGDRRWVRVDNYGHTRSAMATTAPADAPPAVPGQNAPSLEYQMYLFTPGEVTTRLTLGAILNFAPDRGVRLAVSFDDEAPQLVTVVPQGYNAQNGNRDWEQSVRDNARFVTTTHTIAAPGYHTLKVWMVDPAVVLQKIVVNTGDAPVRPSYLGPPAGTPAVR